jgi:RNA polymerase sigma-70 factor (ECF subfamily)
LSEPKSISDSPPAEAAKVSTAAADVALLEKVQRGGREGATVLFEAFGPLVNQTVQRVLGPDVDHDDLVNETFLRAMAGVHRVREAEKLRSWMVSVTLNTVRSELRSRGRWRRIFVREPAHEPPARRGVDHEARALLARVFAILNKMPLEERIVFSLHYLDEQKLEQIAESCGCSARTIKRRLQKARKQFIVRARRDPDLAEHLGAGRWGAGGEP